jgi:hypothetical protein
MEPTRPLRKLSGTLAGIAGEYFIAAELSRRGYVASLTLRNTRGIDILVSNRDATASVGIQVKTSQRDRPTWLLNEKPEKDVAANLFYVFVRLAVGEATPGYSIVPRGDVARFVRDDHRQWLSTPGSRGPAAQRHADA